MIVEFMHKELENKNQVIHECVKFILMSPKAKELLCLLQGNAAHQPTFNGVPQPSGDKALAK